MIPRKEIEMKKIIAILLCMMLIVCMSVPAFAEAAEVPEDPTPTGQMFVSELVAAGTEILATIIKTALMLLSAWLASILGKYVKLKNLNRATEKVIEMAIITVGELQQQFVDTWKKESENGKLNDKQVAELKDKLCLLTKRKLTKPLVDMLQAAAVDINELIIGAGDDLINGRDPFHRESEEDVKQIAGIVG